MQFKLEEDIVQVVVGSLQRVEANFVMRNDIGKRRARVGALFVWNKHHVAPSDALNVQVDTGGGMLSTSSATCVWIKVWQLAGFRNTKCNFNTETVDSIPLFALSYHHTSHFLSKNPHHVPEITCFSNP